MTEIQKQLTIKYRNLFGLSKLLVSNDTPNTIFNDQISNNYCSIIGNCNINNNLMCYSSLYLLNNITCNNLISNGNITITNNSVFNNLTLTDLNINNNCIVNNYVIKNLCNNK